MVLLVLTTLTTKNSKLKKKVFHVEHFFYYLPNFTNKTLISAGETPGIRDA